MELTDPESQNALITYLSRVAESDVTLLQLKKLSGGAIQENWALDVAVATGKWSGTHELVLRKDARTTLAASNDRSFEFALLKEADRAGVQVPTPCFLCADASVLGKPFFLMHRLKGTAAGHVLVKQPTNRDLVRSLATNLARIHQIQPALSTRAFLGDVPADPVVKTIGEYRQYLDDIEARQPAIEFGLAWLERNAPTEGRVTLCHRDYRTGNLMVDEGKLTGILDWEFAGWNNPMEDIGWLMAKCWRFGAKDREAGGLGAREDFYTAYEEASKISIDRSEIAYWEVMAHVRWATIACQQASRHASGEELSLELALTGYLVPELEYEILTMTGRG